MDTIEALNEINTLLRRDLVVRAQQRVIEIEHTACVLPSSMFERVLRAAIKADALLPEYETWCQRAYGRAGYEQVKAQAVRYAQLGAVS